MNWNAIPPHQSMETINNMINEITPVIGINIVTDTLWWIYDKGSEKPRRAYVPQICSICIKTKWHTVLHDLKTVKTHMRYTHKWITVTNIKLINVTTYTSVNGSLCNVHCIPRNKHPCFTWWRQQLETRPLYWPFVRGIHRSPVNSPHKCQWRGVLMLSLICARINSWVNNCEAGETITPIITSL